MSNERFVYRVGLDKLWIISEDIAPEFDSLRNKNWASYKLDAMAEFILEGGKITKCRGGSYYEI